MYTYYQINSDNEISITIQGRLTGITAIVGKESGFIELETPDYMKSYCLWDTYCHYDRFTTIIMDLYFEQATPVKIKLTDRPIDYSTCRRELTDTDKIVKNLKILGFMICHGYIL